MLVELVKLVLRKLKTILQSDIFVNNTHLIALFITISLLSLDKWYLIFLLIPLIFILKRRKYIVIISIILIVFIVTNYFIRENKKSSLDTNINTFTCIVDNVDEEYIKVKYKNEYILVYTNSLYKPGDKLKIYGYLKEPASVNDDYLFNYQKYLNRKNIYYICYAKEIEKIGYSFNINIIAYNIDLFYKTILDSKSHAYVEALIFGNTNYLDKDIYQKVCDTGISHLFSISGLHISIFIIVIGFLIKKFKYKNIILYFILILLMIITSFSASVIRSGFVYILNNIFKKFKLEYDTLDSLSIIYILILLINPYYFYDVGFELSFIVSFALILSSEYLKGNYIFISLKSSLISQIISLPIIINMSNRINILSPLVNIFFIFIFTNLFLPFTLIVAVIPYLKTYYLLMIEIFEELINITDKIKLIITIPNYDYLVGIIYYIFVIYLLAKPNIKKILAYIFLLIIFINKESFRLYGEVYIYDVGMGDTSLISLPNGLGNMVIDCYSNGSKHIIKKGIRKIDYLVLTHGHNDHVNASYDLINNLKVKNIVTNYYEKSEELSKVLECAKNKNINILRLKKGDYFYLDRIKIYILSPSEYDENINNLSLVIYFKLNNISYLFPGDIEDKENLILKYYKELSIDVLKVAHHGSKTSSNFNFINLINPKIAVISAGLNNKYNLPDEEVIKRLEKLDIKIHITYIDGSFKKKFAYY